MFEKAIKKIEQKIAMEDAAQNAKTPINKNMNTAQMLLAAVDNYYDADYNHLPFKQGHENAKVPPQKPVSFEEMKRLAAKLSKGIPHVRVDFYEVNERPIFGEFTFTHFAGMVPFEPEEWDYKFGEWLKLPEISNNK